VPHQRWSRGSWKCNLDGKTGHSEDTSKLRALYLTKMSAQLTTVAPPLSLSFLSLSLTLFVSLSLDTHIFLFFKVFAFIRHLLFIYHKSFIYPLRDIILHNNFAATSSGQNVLAIHHFPPTSIPSLTSWPPACALEQITKILQRIDNWRRVTL